ncbi:MAG: hypothetical protein KDI65_00120 [Alphaproteobacteria bacterium]|nr:hypothetical protein [Alphaproteobacteria bacterium]
MNPHLLFQIVSFMTFIFPSIMAFIWVFMPWPRYLLVRAFLAILLGWVATVLLGTCLYNPVGTMTADARGVADAEMHYDNNIGAIALLAGWVLPSVAVINAMVVRWFIAFWNLLSKPENPQDI